MGRVSLVDYGYVVPGGNPRCRRLTRMLKRERRTYAYSGRRNYISMCDVRCDRDNIVHLAKRKFGVAVEGKSACRRILAVKQ